MINGQREVRVGSCRLSNSRPFVLIAGPCVIESAERTFRIARTLKEVAQRLRVPLIFKCSYDKANRSSVASYRGPGIQGGLDILSRIKKELGIPLLVDVHSVDEVPGTAAVADVLQIPAFLCRQTDLVIAAGQTGRVVNVKKGQFLAPWDALNIVKKVESTGNHNIVLTERGTSFGYNNLIVDMRGIEVMKSFKYPVVFDVTHSVQLPGAQGKSSGGERKFIYPLARAAVAVGVAAVFMEVHPRPEAALSDGANAVPLKHLAELVRRLISVDRTAKTIWRNFL